MTEAAAHRVKEFSRRAIASLADNGIVAGPPRDTHPTQLGVDFQASQWEAATANLVQMVRDADGQVCQGLKLPAGVDGALEQTAGIQVRCLYDKAEERYRLDLLVAA